MIGDLKFEYRNNKRWILDNFWVDDFTGVKIVFVDEYPICISLKFYTRVIISEEIITFFVLKKPGPIFRAPQLVHIEKMLKTMANSELNNHFVYFI